MSQRSDPISASLEALLARFAERVRQAGRRYGFLEADMDEVVQDIRIRLWRALGSGEAIAQAPGSYVFRAATSAALDLLRRRRAQREVEIDPQHPARGERDVERGELADRIADAVGSLSDSRRPVVRMWLAGFDAGEIMQAFGFSEPKVRNLLSRGLADLRARLTEMGIGPEALP